MHKAFSQGCALVGGFDALKPREVSVVLKLLRPEFFPSGSSHRNLRVSESDRGINMMPPPGFRWQPYDTNGAIAVKKEIILRGKKCISPSPVSSEIFKKKKTKYSFWDLCGPNSPFAFCPHSCVTVNELVSHSCTETFKFVLNY